VPPRPKLLLRIERVNATRSPLSDFHHDLV
jgi:hypothetical protein